MCVNDSEMNKPQLINLPRDSNCNTLTIDECLLETVSVLGSGNRTQPRAITIECRGDKSRA